jgi:hypothetical protein
VELSAAACGAKSASYLEVKDFAARTEFSYPTGEAIRAMTGMETFAA